MADQNKVTITGNLGKDIELTFTNNGSAVARTSLAHNRPIPMGNGEFKQNTKWFNVVMWGELGEMAAQELAKGYKVQFEGRLDSRTWTDTRGEKHYTNEIVAETYELIGLPKSKAQTGETQTEMPPVAKAAKATKKAAAAKTKAAALHDDIPADSAPLSRSARDVKVIKKAS